MFGVSVLLQALIVEAAAIEGQADGDGYAGRVAGLILDQGAERAQPSAARTRWHKVLAGAWRDRVGADSLLSSLRAEGVLKAEAGVVVRAPFALLLEAGVPRGAAPARVALGNSAALGLSITWYRKSVTTTTPRTA